jgi:hypothetical protein
MHQQSRDEPLHRNAPVIKEAGIDLRAVRVLWAGEGFLDGASLFRRDASIQLAGLAGENRRIEIAAERIGDHAVGYTHLSRRTVS